MGGGGDDGFIDNRSRARGQVLPLQTVVLVATMLTVASAGSLSGSDHQLLISYRDKVETVDSRSGNITGRVAFQPCCVKFNTIVRLTSSPQRLGRGHGGSWNHSVFAQDLHEASVGPDAVVTSSRIVRFELAIGARRRRLDHAGRGLHPDVPDDHVVEAEELEIFPPDDGGVGKGGAGSTRSSVSGLSFDAASETLYFIHDDLNSIFGANLSQGGDTKLVHKLDGNPSKTTLEGLAFDPCTRSLYWTAKGSEGEWPKVYSKQLDRGHVSSIDLVGARSPRGLTIRNRHLYWVDAASPTSVITGGFSLERMSLASQAKETMCRFDAMATPFSMDATQDGNGTVTFYWTDWTNMAIWRTNFSALNLDDSCRPTPVRRIRNARPMGLALILEPSQGSASRSPGGEGCDQGLADVSVDRNQTLVTMAEKPKIDHVLVPTPPPPSPDLSGGPCSDYCLVPPTSSDSDGEVDLALLPSCHLTSIGTPVCRCPAGFAGERCQVDLCLNYCLNGGTCQRPPTSAGSGPDGAASAPPSCSCPTGYSGSRCGLKLAAEEEEYLRGGPPPDGANNNHLLWTVPALMACLTVCLLTALAVLAVQNAKLRRELGRRRQASGRAAAAPPPARPGSKVATACQSRCSSRTKSTSPCRPQGADHGGVAAAQPFRGQRPRTCSTTSAARPQNGGPGAACPAFVSDDGVVLDLEDCCQMTICNTPCVVEASYRKAINRKPRPHRRSVSGVENGLDLEDQEQHLHQQQFSCDDDDDDRLNLIPCSAAVL